MGLIFNKASDPPLPPLKMSCTEYTDYYADGKKEEIEKVLSAFSLINSKTVWKIFDDTDKWVLYTTEDIYKENKTPYYTMSKATLEIKEVLEPYDGDEYSRLHKNEIFDLAERDGEDITRAMISIGTSYSEDELKEICDAIFEVISLYPEEPLFRGEGELVHGSFDVNDEVFLMNYDGKICGKGQITEIVTEDRDKLTFSVNYTCDEILVFYIIKIKVENETKLMEMSKKIMDSHYKETNNG